MFNISIVLYKASEEDISLLLKSRTLIGIAHTLFIIDNSPTDSLYRFFIGSENIIYIHNPSNPGFGASHNIAIEKSIEKGISYHFVMNPDAYFTMDVISPMLEYMEKNPIIGMMMPQILNVDGSIQNLPKLLPSPCSLILRKLKKPRFIYNNFIDRYELRKVPSDLIYNAPILSGCFTLFRVDALKEVGLYDDKFFMYFEDWDLSRRMHQRFSTVYFPKVSVYHGYESGANKSRRLFKIFVKSAIHYFNKWGWIFDVERHRINKETLDQFK